MGPQFKSGPRHLGRIVARGRSSVVERLLAKEKVTGSNPVARCRPLSSSSTIAQAKNTLATWPSGKAAACKALIRGFESRRRLCFNLSAKPVTYKVEILRRTLKFKRRFYKASYKTGSALVGVS